MQLDALSRTQARLVDLTASETEAGIENFQLAVMLVHRARALVEHSQPDRLALAFTLARLARELDADALQAERLQ